MFFFSVQLRGRKAQVRLDTQDPLLRESDDALKNQTRGIVLSASLQSKPETHSTFPPPLNADDSHKRDLVFFCLLAAGRFQSFLIIIVFFVVVVVVVVIVLPLALFYYRHY